MSRKRLCAPLNCTIKKKKKKGFLSVKGSKGAHLVQKQQQAPLHREQTPYVSGEAATDKRQ